MRVLIAAGMTATVLMVCGGCSTSKMKMPSIPTFGKTKSKSTDASKLTNAPPAPYSATAGTTTPPPAGPGGWSNLPVYPGTTYPQTPYPDPATTAAPAYASQMPASYGTMPPTIGQGTPVNPYTAYPPAGQTAAYAPPAAQGYGQTPPYAAQAGAYGQQPPATSYAQQPAGAPQAGPYGQQPPYTPPAQAPQNAANPYGNYTR